MITNIIRHIARLDSHHRLLIGLIVSIVVYFIVPATASLSAHFTIVWVSYAITILTLMWTTIVVAHPRDLPQLSRLQDSSRTLILIFVVIAAGASLFAVIDLIKDKNQQQYIPLAIGAIIVSWSLVHTVFTIRYAHLYYGNDIEQKKRPGGLDFPTEPEPDYLDFAYFSFVIGMTSQVSDVAVGSKPMRRTALAHGVLSFGFNAIIIALTVGGLS
ncbi:DUF1345 domain-containing protein [Spirosoma flavum]|uniref:DUF1345 domain-containing protein n=1 Tax=Spirosoma flavum TaxID=2048557 RepID=A0ABW6AE26_9BACT